MLKDVSFDVVKFDKGFLNGGNDCDKKDKILRGSLYLVKSLGMNTLAEGVETETQATYLRKLGFDLAQGYFFGRPLPFDRFDKMINDNIKIIDKT